MDVVMELIIQDTIGEIPGTSVLSLYSGDLLVTTLLIQMPSEIPCGGLFNGVKFYNVSSECVPFNSQVNIDLHQDKY